MKSVKLHSHVDSNGMLRLSVPAELKNMDVTVTIEAVTPEPKTEPKTPEELGWSPGFFEQTAGALAEDPITIDFEGEFEKRETLQ